MAPWTCLAFAAMTGCTVSSHTDQMPDSIVKDGSLDFSTVDASVSELGIADADSMDEFDGVEMGDIGQSDALIEVDEDALPDLARSADADVAPDTSAICPTMSPNETRCCILHPREGSHVSSDHVEVMGIAVTGDEGIPVPNVTLYVRSEFGPRPRVHYMNGDAYGYFRHPLQVGTGSIVIEVDIAASPRRAHCRVNLVRD